MQTPRSFSDTELMKFNNKFRLFKWLLAILLSFFAIIVVPLFIYHRFVLKPQNQKWNLHHCENELVKASGQIRTYLMDQVDAAKKIVDAGVSSNFQNGLSLMTYEYNNNKWNVKNIIIHPDFSKLYKIKVDDILDAYRNHDLLHPVSQEIKLEHRTIKDFDMLSIYFVHRNPQPKLVFIQMFPEFLEKSLKTDPTCNLALVDNGGNTIAGYIADSTVKDFLLEYQSYRQNATKAVQSLHASVNETEIFLYNSVLKNLLLVSTVSPEVHPLFAQYLDLFNLNSILILILIAGTCFLALQFVSEKMFIFKEAMQEMSNGVFKPHPTQSEDPLFSELFEDLAKFANHFLYRIRTISKYQKLLKLKDAQLKRQFETEEAVTKKVVSLHLELKNQEAVTYDFKIFQDIAELSSLWASIGELIEDSGGIIDTLTGGTIRALWFLKTVEPRQIDTIVKLALEIQDLVNSINKHRFINNSSPYKIHIGLHRGEMIMTSLGPLERKEFTPIGADLETTIKICGVAKATLAPIVLSHSVFEYVNKNYLFTVLDQTIGDEKLYSLR